MQISSRSRIAGAQIDRDFNHESTQQNGRYSILYRICQCVIALTVFLAWTYLAQTERAVRYDAEGQAVYEGYNLAALANGSGPAPFVQRRLLPDAARFLAAIIPDRVWKALEALIERRGPITDSARSILQWLEWSPQHYPVLFSGYFLIFLSILVFMAISTALAEALFGGASLFSAIFGLLMGVALLGSSGRTFSLYPYDLPNACVFAAAVLGLVKERWWFYPFFIAAVFSKETSAILIAGFLLLRFDLRSRSSYLSLGFLVFSFGVIRYAIVHFYTASTPQLFWFPARNTAVLAKWFVHDLWVNIILLVVVYQILSIWGQIPWQLRRLASLLVPLIGACFFKGFIEERRAYLEVLPIYGLIAAYWVKVVFERADAPLAQRWVRALEHLFVVPARQPI